MGKHHTGNRGVDAKGRSKKQDRYLGLPHFMLNSDAWRSLRPIHRALFIAVAELYNGANNGAIAMGVRRAAAEMHVRPETVGHAFDVLVERGFLRLARNSSFDLKTKRAREWTVTLFPEDGGRATMDFLRWQPRHSESKTRIRKELPSVPVEQTVRNNRTAISSDVSYQEAA